MNEQVRSGFRDVHVVRKIAAKRFRVADRALPIVLDDALEAVGHALELNPEAEEDDETIGSIINITSVGAVHQTSGVAYCASKAALLSATKNTAFMYIHKGIRRNGIAPGGIVTELPITMPPSDPFGFGRTSELLTHSSLLGMPEDVANAALFLAKEDSHFVNGTIITVDGAWTTF